MNARALATSSDSRSDALGTSVRRALQPAANHNAARALALLLSATLGPVAIAQAFPPTIALPTLRPELGGDGSTGFFLQGVPSQGHAAIASSAGDLNGDGIDDIIIGTGFGTYGYVVFGRHAGQSFPAAFDLASLLPDDGGDGTSGFAMHGPNGTGAAVSRTGDVNGDGIDDVMIDAYLAGPAYRGQVYVVFGRETAQAGNFPALLELSTLRGGDGSQGFMVEGAYADGRAGASLSAAGDVNGDGIADMLIGAFRVDTQHRGDAGQTYVLFGRNTAETGNFPPVLDLTALLPRQGGDGSAGFALSGFGDADQSGISVAAADVNDDGLDDVIIGARGHDLGTRYYVGQVYVVYGRATARTGNFPANIPLQALLPGGGGDGSQGFVLNGINDHDNAGHAVGNAGDVNGDGIDDLVIGAYQADPAGRILAGQSYVVFGRNAAVVGNFPPVVNLLNLLPTSGGDGSVGFVINGDDQDRSGYSVSSAGDINSDGIDDLLIGAPGDNPRNEGGRAYVLYGRDTAQSGDFQPVIALPSLFRPGADGSAGFMMAGVWDGNEAAFSVASAGDVNDDGHDDVIVGAFAVSPAPDIASGCYVIYGRAQSP